MFLLRMARRCLNLRRSESGTTLVETVIASALMGMVAISLFSGLAVATESDLVISRLSVAESAARSQIEVIKANSYIDYSAPGHEEYPIVSAPSGYAVQITVTLMSLTTGQPLQQGSDEGMQKIAAAVAYQGEHVTTIEGYKVDR